MKCKKCNTIVDSKFEHAIKSNQCPACGGHLMSPENMASLDALKKLLSKDFKDVDIEKVAGVVIENFDLKRKFQDPSQEDKGNTDSEDIPDSGSIENIEVMEELDPDSSFKQAQMNSAKKILKEQAYEDALRNQYGMGESDEDMFDGADPDNVNPVVYANQIKQESEKVESQSQMLGGGGSFSRSG